MKQVTLPSEFSAGLQLVLYRHLHHFPLLLIIWRAVQIAPPQNTALAVTTVDVSDTKAPSKKYPRKMHAPFYLRAKVHAVSQLLQPAGRDIPTRQNRARHAVTESRTKTPREAAPGLTAERSCAQDMLLSLKFLSRCSSSACFFAKSSGSFIVNVTLQSRAGQNNRCLGVLLRFTV